MLNDKQSLISRLFGIAAQGKGRLIASCTMMTVGTISGVVPYLSVYFIAKTLLISGIHERNHADILFWIIVAAISVLCNMLFTFLGSYGAHKVAFSLLYGIRIQVMKHIGKLPMGFFSNNTSGSIQKTMDDSIEKIEIFIAHLLPDLIGSAFVLTALFGGMFILNAWLAIAILIAVIGAVALQLIIWGGKNGKNILVELATVSSAMTGGFSEYVKGIAEVKLFGLAGTVTKGLKDSIENAGKWEMRLYKKTAPFYEGYKTIILSLLSVALPVGTLLIALNPGNTDIMLAVLMSLIITPAIFSPLMELVNYGTRMGEISVALDSIDRILNLTPIQDKSEVKIPKEWSVEFKNVSFSYQDASDPFRAMALKNIDFIAPQNKMTALVGPSGGGKSTIGQLISRFWDVSEGGIFIGGIDIREMSAEYLMDCVSFVFQDTYIFSDTVINNITMHRKFAQEQVEEAARAARCHEFIISLPQGYNTHIGSGGLGLSGGEAQRLAIARAILKNSPIIVLDEALAYSDAENENLIQKAINTLIDDKTVIIIAHRLPSIKNAHQILLLERGEIKEVGTHSDLMSEDTLYHELWHIQNEADSWEIAREVEI